MRTLLEKYVVNGPNDQCHRYGARVWGADALFGVWASAPDLGYKGGSCRGCLIRNAGGSTPGSNEIVARSDGGFERVAEWQQCV